MIGEKNSLWSSLLREASSDTKCCCESMILCMNLSIWVRWVQAFVAEGWRVNAAREHPWPWPWGHGATGPWDHGPGATGPWGCGLSCVVLSCFCFSCVVWNVFSWSTAFCIFGLMVQILFVSLFSSCHELERRAFRGDQLHCGSHWSSVIQGESFSLFPVFFCCCCLMIMKNFAYRLRLSHG